MLYKNAIVTGYSSGIGFAICEMLKQNNYHIIKLTSRLDNLASLEKEVKGLLKDIEIKNDKHGRPFVILKREMEKLQERRHISEIKISMSHTRNYAQAIAILVGK